jgi:glycosyltransferase involved in cell wall biosynthesis
MLVSILIPVYNIPADYLQKCLDSVTMQTLTDIEIIVVDDGSTLSEAVRLCDSCAAADSRVMVVHQKNGGPSSARNTAIKLANGEYLLFVDGDDHIALNACELLYTKAKEKDLQMLLFGCSQQYPHSIVPYSYDILENVLFDHTDCLELQEKILNFNSNIAAPWGKLVSRKFLLQTGVLYDEDLRLGEGIEFWLKGFGQMSRASFTSERLYFYTYNSASITQTYDEAHIYNTVEAFQRISRFIEKSKNRENLLKNYYDRLAYVIITSEISGYFNPLNKERYAIKKKKYQSFLHLDIVRAALQEIEPRRLSRARRLALLFIRRRWFLLLNLMARARRLQRNMR